MNQVPFYPAAYQLNNVIAVGALSARSLAERTNYGKESMVWEQGSVVAEGLEGYRWLMSGTSPAAAQHTARLVKFFCKFNK